MLVSFTPSIQPQFKAKVITSPGEASKYMTEIFNTKDIKDLKETIRLTQEAGQDVLVRSLKASARNMGIKLD